jgi:hypothetical protein
MIRRAATVTAVAVTVALFAAVLVLGWPLMP